MDGTAWSPTRGQSTGTSGRRATDSKSRRGVAVPMHVQLLETKDAGEVLRASQLFDERPSPEAVDAYLGDPRNVLFLAYEGDAPVGFLRGTELNQLKSKRKQMFLYEIAVEEAHRKQGVGTELIYALLRHCRERNFEEMFVFTDDPQNLAAERLYRSTGGLTETVGDRMYVYRL
jgi:ribosomal protein S18 acetylase RimI-like enzyme